MPLKRNGVPLYLQVAALLERQIDAGRLPPGSRLPTDAELSAAHGVSMITARAAMRVLLDKGRIVRQRAKGTFVRADDRIRTEWGLGSIADLVVTGLKSKLVLLERRTVAAPGWVSEKFALPRSGRVCLFRTARESGGERFTVADIYQPQEIGRLITESDFKDGARQNKLLISLVQEKTGIRTHDIHQWMSAGIADERTAADLGIAMGAPYLLAERDYYSSEGRLVQTGRSWYRVDRYRYQMNFSRFLMGDEDDRTGRAAAM